MQVGAAKIVSMTRAIAIDTSGQIGSIALVEDARLLAGEDFPHGLQHAAQILPIIDRLTRAQGWTPRDVNELYISIGPGSFTGLRISATLAKTMALATGVKIVAVPTVAVLAENAPPDARHLVIVLDAKRDQIFTARFERSDPANAGGGAPGGEVALLASSWIAREPAHLDSLEVMLQRAPRPVHLLGEGIPYHRKFIPSHDDSIILTPPELWRARADAVAKIGSELAQAGRFADPLTLQPLYIRRPEAEEKFMADQPARS